MRMPAYTIYKIFCRNPTVADVYVGHTSDFVKRKLQHRHIVSSPLDQSYHLKVYQSIRANGGWTNWDAVPIETCLLETRDAARVRERYWAEQLNATLNSVRPICHRDDLLAGKKNSYQRCREKILKTKSIVVVCDCGVSVSRGKLARHRRSLIHKSVSCK